MDCGCIVFGTESYVTILLIIEGFLHLVSLLAKSWANILCLPYFTELFLKKSLNHPRLLFNFKVDGKLYFFSAPQTQNTDDNSSLVATHYRTHSFNHINGISYLLQVHGLFITLPEVKEILPYPKTYCGYDPTDKQFKVLCVSANSASTRAHVLTLKTGKHLWRMIECTPHHTVVSHGISIARWVCFNVRSEKFSYIKMDDESTTGACTLINYKGKQGGVQFTDTCKRNLRLWLVEQDHAGKYKWSSNIYVLTLSFRGFDTAGMTGTSDIVLSTYYLSDPFYVFYYNVERKGFDKS
ncbi:hypothetical protein BRARA_D00494 [Brassica rapa]|nr:hypothetical protein BRARA_D00494 [Brassica rapa]